MIVSGFQILKTPICSYPIGSIARTKCGSSWTKLRAGWMSSKSKQVLEKPDDYILDIEVPEKDVENA